MSKHPKSATSHSPERGIPTTQQSKGWALSRRAWIGVATGGAALALIGERWWRSSQTADPALTPITVYASPACSCCGAWVAQLENNGFRVTSENAPDVSAFKRKYGVPEKLWSCHTAVVEGYVVEGHVPADLIHKMIKERPAIAGLAVPGMPAGSPGMEGPSKDRYDVIGFTRTGSTEVYATR
jgi:hypothetical protein